MNMENNEIVLDFMYNGRYLRDNNNIGFEIINLYKTDKGENYIYLLPYGTFDRKKHGHIETVLLVRKMDELPVLEVYGKASGLELVENHKVLSNTVTYAGVKVKDIFSNCKKQEIWCTFKADKVVRPKEKLYIAYAQENNKEGKTKKDLSIFKKIVYLEKVNLPKQAQKQYFGENGPNQDDYNVLKAIINDDSLWASSDDIKRLEIGNENQEDLGQSSYHPNMFDIAGIEDRELAFSHAHNFFMTKYPELVREFFYNKGHQLKLFSNGSLTVVSESEANIDLLVKTQSHIIVIENKIRSGINGIDNREDKRLNQLKKYYDYIEKEYVKKDNSTAGSIIALFYVLRPDYSNFNLSEYNPQHIYEEIKYSEVYNFLLGKIRIAPYKDDWYLRDFVAAMQRHTLQHYEDQHEVMERKFKNVISRIKKALSIP